MACPFSYDRLDAGCHGPPFYFDHAVRSREDQCGFYIAGMYNPTSPVKYVVSKPVMAFDRGHASAVTLKSQLQLLALCAQSCPSENQKKSKQNCGWMLEI